MRRGVNPQHFSMVTTESPLRASTIVRPITIASAKATWPGVEPDNPQRVERGQKQNQARRRFDGAVSFVFVFPLPDGGKDCGVVAGRCIKAPGSPRDSALPRSQEGIDPLLQLNRCW